jgi:signal transduction histidine kinase
VIHPLQILGREASRLAWGDFQAIDRPAGGIGEITDLQAALQEMAAQINRYQAGMRDYIAALTATQEEERRRLARELHDETVQSIIALGQRVKILQLDLQDGRAAAHERDAEDVDARLNELGEMIAACLKDVRGLIRDLRPIYLEELGLASALEMLARGASGSQMNATLEVEGAERRLSPEAELAVYRIAQAAVSNAQHHSAAATVAVRLEFGDDGVVLTVEDDGAGFAPPDRPSDLALEGHFGLMGMYERATRLGGHLSIRSSPGAGAKIAAFLPYAGQIAAS